MGGGLEQSKLHSTCRGGGSMLSNWICYHDIWQHLCVAMRVEMRARSTILLCALSTEMYEIKY